MKINRYNRGNRIVNLFEIESVQTLSYLDFGKCTHSVNNMLSLFYIDSNDVNLLTSLYDEWYLYIIRKLTECDKIVYSVYYADIHNTEVTYND